MSLTKLLSRWKPPTGEWRSSSSEAIWPELRRPFRGGDMKSSSEADPKLDASEAAKRLDERWLSGVYRTERLFVSHAKVLPWERADRDRWTVFSKYGGYTTSESRRRTPVSACHQPASVLWATRDRREFHHSPRRDYRRGRIGFDHCRNQARNRRCQSLF